MVGIAGPVKERSSVLWGKLHDLMQQLFHAIPGLGAHTIFPTVLPAVLLIWRCSQTRAVAQSRSTVAREIPNTSEISGDDSPPKNFISTIFPWRSSTRDSASSESFNARSSASSWT